jgi:elongation factor Ts
MDAAVDWLRTKGLAAAAKKAGRVASEGLIGVAVAEDGLSGALIEINAETDFVARNDTFQAFVSECAGLALTAEGDIERLGAMDYPGGEGTVQDQVVSLVATIGENIQLRRTAAVAIDDGVVASYVHTAAAPGLGKIGVLVALESAGDKEKLAALGKQLAMHVAATTPEAVSVDDLDQTLVERERNVLSEQARESGKPEEIIAKMVEGRLRKFYEEVVLDQQVFVIDGETRIGKVLENAAKDAGAPIKVAAFVRFGLGEGIEKKEEDFAAEVAAVAGGA